MPLLTPSSIANKSAASAGVRAARRGYVQNGLPEAPQWDLVEKYLPLLKSIVSKMRIYFPSKVDLDDIYSVGMTGLVSATVRYDSKKAKSFGSYAALRIRGAILDELRRMDWLSRKDRARVKALRSSIEELEQRMGRPLAEDEIIKELKISAQEYQCLMDYMRPLSFIPLDAPASETDSSSSNLSELLSDITDPDARDICEKHDVIECLRERIGALPETQQKILVYYYYEDLRLAEIADILELTESRICQIHTQTIIGLRGYLKNLNKYSETLEN